MHSYISLTEYGAGFEFYFLTPDSIRTKPTIMNTNSILKADILDIIFEKRNKAYGAYTLRRSYPHRMKMALGGMFLVAVLFSAFTLIPGKKEQVNTRTFEIEGPTLADAEKPKEEVKKPEEKKPETKQPEQPKADPKPVVSNTQTFTNPVIVDNNLTSDSIKTLKDHVAIGSVTINVPSAPPPVVAPPAPPVAAASPAPTVDVNTPMKPGEVDVMPSFPGGIAALQKFLEKNLENPYDAENGETVTVKMKFVVGYNGKLKSFETVQDGGEVYNKEVVRVLKKMPDWEPGKARGEHVSVYYTIPVKFVMSN